MIYAIKNDGESNEKLVLRYKKLFFGSRTAQEIKSKRYAVKKITKKKERESAIIREWYRELSNGINY